MRTLILVFLSISILHCYADLASDMLEAHNNVRVSLGIPQLVWADDLASKAQRWANHLASTGESQHSEGRTNVGENIAGGSAGDYTAVDLFELWIREEENFIPGRNYPDCTNGRGKFGHYTQVVWEKTTEVGCGFAERQRAKLVCQYRTRGNMMGEPVYTVGGSGNSNTQNNENTEDNLENQDAPTTSFPGISWSMFKARPSASSPYWAYTIWNAPYTYDIASTEGNHVKVTVDAWCELDENTSWIRSQYESDELLRHEQGHYFIGSIFALNFKKQAQAMTFSATNYDSQIEDLYNNLLDDYLDYEKRYDLETNHYNNKPMQKKWEADIINQINDLEDYWW